MPSVKLSVRKEFGSVVAVDDINLTISDGEFVTLVGPSGCGKTTTLRMAAGLETPTSGTIEFGDRDVTDLPPQERNVAMLFQDIALYPHMTVRENIAYGLKIAGVDKEERDNKVEEAAEMLQITELLETKPTSLSGGQQQRVALGRSIVRDPSIFLFDEPMSDLDAKLKRELRPLIVEITEQVGCPTLYVTHDQEEAITMSDRVAVMNEGQIEQVGTPQDVYNKPATKFVGEFIGEPAMEFFEGDVITKDGNVTINIGGYSIDLSAKSKSSVSQHQKVTIGIRPQDIIVNKDGEGIDGEHALDQPYGDETHSYFDTEFGRVTAVTASNFQPSQTNYSLQLTKEKILMFDTDTGERIVEDG